MTDSSDAIAEMLARQADVEKVAVASAGEQPWSSSLVIYLSTSILLLTALALVLASVLLWKKGDNHGHDVLRIFGVVIIVGLSALLLVAGFSNEQLTPIVGLFGAVAGYLLGKDSKSGT